MQKFAELYSEISNLPQVGEDFGNGEVETIFAIPWGHHKLIIDKCNGNRRKALFFVNQVLQNGWSRAVLLNFLDTDLFERQGKAITNFSQTLPAIQSDLAQEITKDPYKFDFITLTQSYNEKELKDALMDNSQKFLLELGNGFRLFRPDLKQIFLVRPFLLCRGKAFCFTAFFSAFPDWMRRSAQFPL